MKSSRKIILRVLLGSLAIAAAAGVFAVLLPNRDMMMRVMVTGLATALAGVMIFPLSIMLDRSTLRPAGLFGMSVVIAEFLLMLAITWLPNVLGQTDDKLGLTMMLLFVAGATAMVYLLFVRNDGVRIAAWSGVVFMAIALGAFMIAIWLPGSNFMNGEWLGTGWTFWALSVPAFASLVGFARGDRKHWRGLGALASALSAITTMLKIWENFEFDWLIALAISIALLTGYANLILLLKLKAGQPWLRFATLGFALLTAVLINILIDTDFDFLEDLLSRGIAASGIVTGCGTLAMVLLAAFNRRSDADFTTAKMYSIMLTCPRCASEQTIPIGGAMCAECKLRIDIRIEEPRCTICDYLLYQLQSDRCPECGTKIVDDDGVEPHGGEPRSSKGTGFT